MQPRGVREVRGAATPLAWLARGLRLLQVGAVLALVAVLGVAWMRSDASPVSGRTVAAAGSAVPDCRAHIPDARGTRAVVRMPSGQIRVVSFERGWAVYTGREPGTFLRVCVA